MEKKPKVEKIKKNKVKFKLSSFLFIILSLLLTFGLFMGLIYLENFFLNDVAYKKIVVVEKKIAKNTIITEDNVDNYFKLKDVNVLDITDGALTNYNKLINLKAIVPLYEGEVVTLKDFENLNIYTKDLKEPVEISIKIPDISNANGGKLRAGDLVNITMMFTKKQLGLTSVTNTGSLITNSENSNNNTITNENFYNYDNFSQYIMENLYISKVYDSTGSEISSTNTESSASILVFVIEKSEESRLNNALENCSSLRISKILIKPDEAYNDIE